MKNLNEEEMLLIGWWRNTYALGWRGWLAKKLLKHNVLD